MESYSNHCVCVFCIHVCVEQDVKGQNYKFFVKMYLREDMAVLMATLSFTILIC